MGNRRKADHVTYETEEKSRRALIEICVFLFFVSLTTYIAISLQTIYTFYFNRNLDRLFSKRVSNQMEVHVKFEQISTIDEFWSFLLTTFFQNLRGNWEVASSATEVLANMDFNITTERMLFLSQNLILEAPRLRQIRVKPEPCYKHTVFRNLYNECYGHYESKNEFTEPIYKNTPFYSLDKTSVRPFWGNLETYYGAGYVATLTFDDALNEAIVGDLREQNWIDRASRLIMIELVIYNNNMDLFNNVKFVAEIMPVGGIVSYSHMEVAPLFLVWSTYTPGFLAANVVFYCFIIFNTANEISEIIQFGLKAYLKSVWNYIDWGILVAAYTSLALSILHKHFIDEYLESVFSQKSLTISSIDRTCYWFSIYVSTMALAAFLVWIRIFRFISFNKTMLAFYLALKQCAGDIFGFAIILFLVYMAFALLGLALFGTSDLDFSTFQYAYFFMMRLNLHDFEYANFERSDPLWGQLYFMCFIVVVVFLCFNMFLAIISQTYINVKKETIESRSEIRAVLLKLFRTLQSCCGKVNKNVTTRARPAGRRGALTDTGSEALSIQNLRQAKPSDERVQKKLQFQSSLCSDDSIGQPTIASAPSSDASPRLMGQEDALREFFGVRRSGRLKRSVSQDSISTFATPASSYAEDEGEFDDWDKEADDDFDDVMDEKNESKFSSSIPDEDISSLNTPRPPDPADPSDRVNLSDRVDRIDKIGSTDRLDRLDRIDSSERVGPLDTLDVLDPLESLKTMVEKLEHDFNKLSGDITKLMHKMSEIDKLMKAAQN